MEPSFPERVTGLALILVHLTTSRAEVIPAPQRFRQEIAHQYTNKEGLPRSPVQLLDCGPSGTVKAFVAGNWYSFQQNRWVIQESSRPAKDNEFALSDRLGQEVRLEVAWRDVRQVVCQGSICYVALSRKIFRSGKDWIEEVWPDNRSVNQMALDADAVLYVASDDGLF